jgi:predicted RNA methylase
VFDERSERFADARRELTQLLDEREWRAASKTTLNAHYTDAAIAQTMWDVVTDAGFGADREPVRVLEPGCGAGTFIGLAPAAVTAKDSALFGVELDPTAAAIAKHLYPHADIRQESFADTRIPRSYLDLVIGNVPFGKVALHDPVHNGATFHLSLLKGHEKLAPPKGHRNARSTAPERHNRDRRDDSRNAAEEQRAEQLHGGHYPACSIAGRPGRAASCTPARHRPNARVRTDPHQPVADAGYPHGSVDQDPIGTDRGADDDRCRSPSTDRQLSLDGHGGPHLLVQADGWLGKLRYCRLTGIDISNSN